MAFCFFNSVSYFSSRFKEEKGVSPLKYLNDLRIELACKYLRNSNYKINQICFFVGFDNPLYFSKMFRRNMGMSPKEYREYWEEKSEEKNKKK